MTFENQEVADDLKKEVLIINTDLEPSDTHQPLPPIKLEDIGLICWLALEASEKITTS